MKYALEMGSHAKTYISSFTMTGSSIQKLVGGIHKHRDSMVIDKLTFYIQNRESRLKTLGIRIVYHI
jgi:hypothetical protein